MTKTSSKCIADTVEFFHKDVPILKTSSVDMAIKIASELTHALQNPASASSFHKFGDSTLAALEKLATIFEKAVATEPTRVGEKEAKKQQPTKISIPSSTRKIQAVTTQPPRVAKIPDKHVHIILVNEHSIITDF